MAYQYSVSILPIIYNGASDPLLPTADPKIFNQWLIANEINPNRNGEQ